MFFGVIHPLYITSWNNLLTPILPAVILTSVWTLLGIDVLFVVGAGALMTVIVLKKKKK